MSHIAVTDPWKLAEEMAELKRENAALRAELEAQAVVNGKGSEREAKLLAEVAALRKDKERLDWLEEQSDNMGWLHQCRYSSIRAAIDAARKEAQP